MITKLENIWRNIFQCGFIGDFKILSYTSIPLVNFREKKII